jgi:hypothetical protein
MQRGPDFLQPMRQFKMGICQLHINKLGIALGNEIGQIGFQSRKFPYYFPFHNITENYGMITINRRLLKLFKYFTYRIAAP